MALRANLESVDVAGVGINATDTIIRLPHFPAPDSKVEMISADVRPGGQVASAIVACRRWGLSARYVGKVGDDAAGKYQMDEMAREQVEAHWIIVEGCESQSAFILVNERSGERTVLWKRDGRIALRPDDLRSEWISGARVLLVDGHDTAAATRAARWARKEKTPVVADLDNLCDRIQALLEHVDFPITSKEFPERLIGEEDLLKSLPKIHREFKLRLTLTTIGRLGTLAWDGAQFILCPGFRMHSVDTTGAGDIFHGAFLYGLFSGLELQEILEFSCAAAAINCKASGARGGIGTLEEIEELRQRGERSESAYTRVELQDAARAAGAAQ
jgi:sulfofructose kinase